MPAPRPVGRSARADTTKPEVKAHINALYAEAGIKTRL